MAVYAGAGASHSWTWWADCLEMLGYSWVRIVDEGDVAGGALGEVDVFAVGGGDPVAMGAGLGAPGAAAVDRFVREGGSYLGICAGAYLVMRLDYEPLAPFAFTGVRPGNVVWELPAIRVLPEKAATAYGGRYALHPVREAVSFAFRTQAGGSIQVEAPLYGGAPMLPSPAEVELACFASFAPRTLYLVDEGLAADMLLGRAAACRSSWGSGGFYLLAPHLEHPAFPEANAMLGGLIEQAARARRAPGSADLGSADPGVSDLGSADPVKGAGLRAVDAVSGGRGRRRPVSTPTAGDGALHAFRAALGEARIVAYALESAPASWLLGHKYYDPGKIPVFLDAVWRRLGRGGRVSGEAAAMAPGVLEDLADRAGHAVDLLRSLKTTLADPVAGRDDAARLFPVLSGMTALFLDQYFHHRRTLFAGVHAAREAS